MGYQVEILNDYNVTVSVEIRTGNNPNDFSQNTLFYEGDLAAGDSKTTDNLDPIVCYRRTADTDNPAGGLGGWNTFSPDETNTPITIKLTLAGGA
jgi:hypothetical protein